MWVCIWNMSSSDLLPDQGILHLVDIVYVGTYCIHGAYGYACFFLTPDFDGIWSNLFSLLTRQTLDWWHSWDIINLYIVSQLEFNISLINFFIDDSTLSTFFHQSDHSWFNVFILILSSSTFEYLLYFVWFHSFFPSSSYINRNIWYCIPSSSPTNHWC